MIKCFQNVRSIKPKTFWNLVSSIFDRSIKKETADNTAVSKQFWSVNKSQVANWLDQQPYSILQRTSEPSLDDIIKPSLLRVNTIPMCHLHSDVCFASTPYSSVYLLLYKRCTGTFQNHYVLSVKRLLLIFFFATTKASVFV